ncbi:hypothetical protein SNARM312S_00141 [Streptomyces narbonensis]
MPPQASPAGGGIGVPGNPNRVGFRRCYAGAMQFCHSQARYMRLRRS